MSDLDRERRQAAVDLDRAIMLMGQAHQLVVTANARAEAAMAEHTPRWTVPHELFIASEDMKSATRHLTKSINLLNKAAERRQERS